MHILNQFSLPNDVWNHIFCNMSNIERIQTSRVCKLFQTINDNLPEEFWSTWANKIISNEGWVSKKVPNKWKAGVIEQFQIKNAIGDCRENLLNLYRIISTSNTIKDKWLVSGYVSNTAEIFSRMENLDDVFHIFANENEFKNDSLDLVKSFFSNENVIPYPELNIDLPLYMLEDREHIVFAALAGIAPAQNYMGDYFKGKLELSFDDHKVSTRHQLISEINEKEIKLNKCAFRCYECAALQLNYPPAMYNLGKCYENGFGCDQNHNQAFYWYKKSADQGQAKSMYRVGKCYEMSIGCSIDSSKALSYYVLAAQAGDELSNYHAGYCYEHGIGCDINMEKAYEYYQKISKLPRITNKLMEFRRRNFAQSTMLEPPLKKVRIT